MKSKLIQKIKFAFKRYPLQILIAIALASSFLLFSTKRSNFHQTIDWLDPIIGMLTLLVAILVWLIQLTHEWEDSLSKRLTVKYEYKGRIVMQCEEALLVGESDIRNWGQQIGAQMSFTPFLKFDPYFKIEKPVIRFNETWGEWYKLYAVSFYLNELPDLKNASKDQKEEWDYNFKKEFYLSWKPNYNNDRTIQKIVEWKKAMPNRHI